MADNNLPGSAPGPDVAPGPASYDDQVAGLADLLDDHLDDDPVSDAPAHEEAADAPTAAAEPEQTDEDDPLGLNADAEDVGEADADETDGSDEPEIKGGRFAPDTAKVTLEDGTVITVADLKRNNLFQRDYTKKTTELKAEREAFETERTSFSQQAQSLEQFREYAAWYAEQHLPKQPEPFKGDPTSDPMGYMQWQHRQNEWLTHVQAYQAFQQQKTQQESARQTETAEQAKQRLMRERDALLKAIPVLKDPSRGRQVWDNIVSGASEHYGITAEEVGAVADHRMLVALRDALAYRALKAKAPQTKADVAQKPAMKPGKRNAPQAAVTRERQDRTERLRKTGRMDAAVASLMDLDL